MMIRTPRLILRTWQPEDLLPFAEQNADPVVMRCLGGVLTREESDAYADRTIRHFADHGFCKWAVEAPGVSPFIGAVGITHVRIQAPFTPAVEVAWRLNRKYWARGYATEAALAAVADGFDRIGLAEIVAMTAVGNFPSRRVMDRLGMAQDMEFDHPTYPAGHPLQRHVLYRLNRDVFIRRGADA